MRKFMISLLAISFFVVTLFGCRQDKNTDVCTLFSCDAVIVAENREIKTKLSSTYGHNITLSFESPDSIKGLTYRVLNSNVHISYDSLECTVNTDYLPQFSYADVVIETLLCMQKNKPEFLKEGDDYNQYKVKNKHGDVLVFADKKTGLIAIIVPMYTDCKIMLSNVKKW